MSRQQMGSIQKLVLKNALLDQDGRYQKALIYSLIVGFLSLASTLFMLEVYDRVVNSRNSLTLLMLLVAVIGAHVMQEMLEIVRHGVMNGVSQKIDQEFSVKLFNVAFEARLQGHSGGTAQALTDLRTVRDFFSSDAAMAILDVPMSFVCFLIVFFVSPWLGVFALVGAVVQVWIAVQTERSTMPALAEANKSAINSQNYATGALRNAQVIEAMGMTGAIHKKWLAQHRIFLSRQASASDTAGTNSAASKFIQNMQTSLLLGASCWLTLKGQMLGGGGMMIVASTLGGKVLTPLVQLVAQWRVVSNAKDSYQRLEGLLSNMSERVPGMPLPAPKGLLTVEGLVAGAPRSPIAILKGVSFAIQPGECLVLVGPSASGKTTLARLVMGLWPASSGKVRLDGADVFTWDKSELGPHLGYLPQTVELFEGTVAENIARFGDVNFSEVERVIQQVGLTQTIAALPNGVHTDVGSDGAILSGGQRQRVALARAIYGTPKFLVLDEPNSSLDEAGEAALIATLAYLKSQGCSVMVITHRTSLLPAADKVLILRDGQVAAFGPRDEVLAALQKSQEQARQQALQNQVATQANHKHSGSESA